MTLEKKRYASYITILTWWGCRIFVTLSEACSIYLLLHFVVAEEPVPSDTQVMWVKSHRHGLMTFSHPPRTVTHIVSLQAISNAHRRTVTFFATDTQSQVGLTFLSQVSTISHCVDHSPSPDPPTNNVFSLLRRMNSRKSPVFVRGDKCSRLYHTRCLHVGGQLRALAGVVFFVRFRSLQVKMNMKFVITMMVRMKFSVVRITEMHIEFYLILIHPLAHCHSTVCFTVRLHCSIFWHCSLWLFPHLII